MEPGFRDASIPFIVPLPSLTLSLGEDKAMAAEKSLTDPRLALFYGAVFMLIGFLAPFWPVWLADHGLGPTEIGIVMACGVGVKILSNPLCTHAADRRGLRRPIMIVLAIAAFGAFSLFALTDGFWPILLVTVLFFAVWSPIMPLGESLAMLSGSRGDEGGEPGLFEISCLHFFPLPFRCCIRSVGIGKTIVEDFSPAMSCSAEK